MHVGHILSMSSARPPCPAWRGLRFVVRVIRPVREAQPVELAMQARSHPCATGIERGSSAPWNVVRTADPVERTRNTANVGVGRG
mgnify:CR=1 FL=1